MMTDIVKTVHNGTWDKHPCQDWWYGLAERGVRLVPFSDVRKIVETKKAAKRIHYALSPIPFGNVF